MSQRSSARPRRPSLVAALLLAAASVLALAACTSGGDGGGDGVIRTVLAIFLESGSDMRGAQAELGFDPSFVVVATQPAGPFIGETCEVNVGSNFLSLLCVKAGMATFNSPVTAWRVTVDHPASVDPVDLVSSLECLASDTLGNTFPIACSLD